MTRPRVYTVYPEDAFQYMLTSVAIFAKTYGIVLNCVFVRHRRLGRLLSRLAYSFSTACG